MGMFDKEPNFGEAFKEGERFVLTGAEYVGKISTREGPAEKSIFKIVCREHPAEEVSYSVLGVGFANQARRAKDDDFPQVVEYITVPTGTGDNRVKIVAPVNIDPRQFLEGDDGPQLDDQTIRSTREDSNELGF